MKKNATIMTVMLMVLVFGIVFYSSVFSQTSRSISPWNKFKNDALLQSKTSANPIFNLDIKHQQFKSINESYPQEIHHFYWDVTTIWMADHNRHVTYDDSGNILTEIMTDASTGDTLGRYINIYDNDGDMTESLYQNWIDGDWENYFRDLYTYDEHGNEDVSLHQEWLGSSWYTYYGTKNIIAYNAGDQITEWIYQYWDSGLNEWVNFFKEIYTYDTNGHLVEYIDQYWTGMEWGSAYKEIYTIDQDGVITEALIKDWDEGSSSWVNDEKIINVVWHHWTGDPFESEIESFTSLEWASGIWENYLRVNYTYDGYGGFVEIDEEYIDGSWENMMRYTESYDQHENYLGFQFEGWLSGNWVIEDGYKYILTYSGDDLVVRIAQEYDYEQEEYINQEKEEYSDFINIDGVFESPFDNNALTLYPNPCDELFNIQTSDLQPGNLYLEVINTSGQIVYQNDILYSGKADIRINLSGTSHGIYVVKLITEEEMKIGKVVLR